MTDIRLLVLDIDGTLAGESNQVSAPVQQAIAAAQARGIAVAIATGRMYQSALRFHQAVGSTLPLIAYQGAWIQDPALGTHHRHLPLDRLYTLEILTALAELEAQQALSVHLYAGDQLHVRSILPETVAYAERSAITPQAVGDLATFLQENPGLETTKLLALSPDPALTAATLAHLRQQYPPEVLYFTQSVSTFFEVTHPQANKGQAVQFLAEALLGLQPAQVMAVGDNFNDLEMLIYAGIGVAMGDAPVPVQAQADWVAPGVEADGVARAIERFLL